MTGLTPTTGTLLQIICEHGETSVILPLPALRELFRSATEIAATYKAPELETMGLIRDQIRQMAATDAVGNAIFSENEARIRNMIALFSLGLVAARPDVASLLVAQLDGKTDKIVIRLNGENVEIAVSGGSWQWGLDYWAGKEVRETINRH